MVTQIDAVRQASHQLLSGARSKVIGAETKLVTTVQTFQNSDGVNVDNVKPLLKP